ncbi:putative alcohol dehydrogenase GroES-like domain [Lyophyllum shimeji]|uniref:alcohol dehydrogenase n=1 Tax=Lyophyllum shimeji TaxID=47721 RepID=A0A9P3PQY9_LYOSH|nr:putative alcohol dehydrogenase GroES-like domain [Lyophyllum shimeji]
MVPAQSIPKKQTAAVLPKLGASITIQKDYPVKQPEELAPGECLVKLHCTGVCHTDRHATSGDWPIEPKLPLVSGHEGVGEIVAIGNNTQRSPVKMGDRVGVKWIADSCLNCEHCRKGREQNCDEVKLSGFNIDGTYANYVVSYVTHVTPIPEGIDSNEAASILCAGLTVYRTLKHSQTNPGDWVVVPGAGGGLGHLAIQYAKYMGRHVIAIDTGAEKEQLCRQLGADVWIDFKQSKDLVADIKKATGGHGAHSTIVTTTTSSAFKQAIEYVRKGGTVMAVGMPGKLTLDASIFYTVVKNISIIGSYVGNRQDAIEAMQIAAEGKVRVKYEMRKLDQLEESFKAMIENRLPGRVVIDMRFVSFLCVAIVAVVAPVAVLNPTPRPLAVTAAVVVVHSSAVAAVVGAMNSDSTNAIAGPSTSRSSPPAHASSTSQLFLPPPAPPKTHTTHLSSTQDLLTRFHLLSAYDKYVRPSAAPADTGLDQVRPSPVTPGATGLLDKGKGKEVEGMPVTPGAGDGDGDDDDGGKGEKKKRNNYKHLIKGIPGKHSMKKDDFLSTMMQIPPKQRIRITPFDLKTQREAFTVSLEGLKGWNPNALVLESAQAREDRKKRKEAKRLQKLQAQAALAAPVAQPPPIQAPVPTSATPAAFSRPPQNSASSAVPSVPRPGSTVPKPGSAAAKPAVARPGSTAPRPASAVPRPGSTKPSVPPIQMPTARVATPLRSGTTGPGTPLRSTTTVTPTSTNPYQPPIDSEKRGTKRERDDMLPAVNGVGVTNGNGNVVVNAPKAVVNAKAGTAGIRPRPIKKQRMVSTYVWFTILLSVDRHPRTGQGHRYHAATNSTGCLVWRPNQLCFDRDTSSLEHQSAIP